MTDLDRLPPDQRAVLSLVLDRAKSYAEVGELLGIPEETVRDRAHAALDALARDAEAGRRTATPPRSRSNVARTRAAAPGPSERTAAAGTGQVASAGSGNDPSRPLGGASAPFSRAGQAGAAGAHGVSRSSRGPGSSRRTGALLLAAIVVVIVVAIVLVSSGGGKSGSPTTTNTSGASSTPTSTTTSTGSSAAKAKLDSTITLGPSEPSLKANGTAYVLSQGGRRAFYIAAQGLPPSTGFFYAVWLYNSPSSAEPLGRASNVTSNGRLEGGNPLPSSAADYAKIIVTRETSTHPSRPGPTVLSGTFKL